MDEPPAGRPTVAVVPALGSPTIGLVLTLLTVGAFLPALRCGFVSWDNPQLAPGYSIVLQGISWPGVKWAFTHLYFANWAPLSVLSHMLDWQLFGTNAGGHHLTSVVLHAGVVVGVFALWRNATGSSLRAAVCAALFGVHPLRVESVVWLGERKDVLSGVFALATLLLYVSWTRRRSTIRYLAMAATLVLALLAKAIVVTLPVAMLLLDFWPLGRLVVPDLPGWGARLTALWRSAWPLLCEKLPLLLLMAAGGVGAVAGQGESMVGLAALPLSVRVGNVFLSYARYLGETFWPANLSAFYELPPTPPGWRQVLPAVLLFAAITAIALVNHRRRPWLLFGWAWFVVVLLPVSGLLQSGDQAMADRYTYLPSVGLLAALVWTAADELRGTRTRRAMAVVTAALVVACVLGTRSQIAHWRNDEAMYSHTVEVDPEGFLGHLNYGGWLAYHGRLEEAVAQYQCAVALRPRMAVAHRNLGNALRARGDLAAAGRSLQEAIRLDPGAVQAHLDLAAVYADEGKVGPAIGHLASVIALEPSARRAWQGLADLLSRPGATAVALPYVEAVASTHPGSRELQQLLATLRGSAGGR